MRQFPLKSLCYLQAVLVGYLCCGCSTSSQTSLQAAITRTIEEHGGCAVELLSGASGASSLGSGFVIDKSIPLIVTNAHVVNDARSLTVRLSASNASFEGKVVLVDREQDLALLKGQLSPDVKEIRECRLSSKAAKVGEFVLGVGNPARFDMSWAFGIVAATDRELIDARGGMQFIQIAFQSAPGMSGGPVLSLSGDALGVITRGVPNLASTFAIPAAHVEQVLKSYELSSLDVAPSKSADRFLPFLVQPLSPGLRKVLGVSKEAKGIVLSDASLVSIPLPAFVKDGAVITAINGREVSASTWGDLTSLVSQLRLSEGLNSATVAGAGTFEFYPRPSALCAAIPHVVRGVSWVDFREEDCFRSDISNRIVLNQTIPSRSFYDTETVKDNDFVLSVVSDNPGKPSGMFITEDTSSMLVKVLRNGRPTIKILALD